METQEASQSKAGKMPDSFLQTSVLSDPGENLGGSGDWAVGQRNTVPDVNLTPLKVGEKPRVKSPSPVIQGSTSYAILEV